MTGDKKSVSSVVLSISVRTLINILIIFFLVEGFIEAYHFSYKVFADHPYVAASNEVMNVTIQEGMDMKQVALVLDESGIVDGKYLFLARVYLGEYQNKLKAGSYQLGPGMSPDEICKKICGIQSEEMT